MGDIFPSQDSLPLRYTHAPLGFELWLVLRLRRLMLCSWSVKLQKWLVTWRLKTIFIWNKFLICISLQKSSLKLYYTFENSQEKFALMIILQWNDGQSLAELANVRIEEVTYLPSLIRVLWMWMLVFCKNDETELLADGTAVQSVLCPFSSNMPVYGFTLPGSAFCFMSNLEASFSHRCEIWYVKKQFRCVFLYILYLNCYSAYGGIS